MDTLITGLDTFAGELSSSDYLATDNGTDTTKIDAIKASRSGYGGVIASTYTPSTYSVGDYVIYSGLLYKCIADITTAEEWTASHWEQVILADDITEYVDTQVDTSTTNALENILPQDTAQGAIASFPDGTALLPAIAVDVQLEPIQDLHGYDKPWSGGAGKNKFDASTVLVGYYISNVGGGAVLGGPSDYASDYIEVEAGQTYMISPTLSSGNWGAWYDENKVFISGITDYSTAKTAPSNAKYMRFTVSRNGSNPNYATTTQVEKGSTATAWTPYSNICPISGRTECVTYVSGINVWDEEWEVGSYDASGAVGTNDRMRTKNYIPCVPETQYYYSIPSDKGNMQIWFYDADKNYLDFYNFGTTHSFTTPPNCRYMRANTGGSYGTTYNHDISINYPSTDHDYHAYNGTSYTTDLGRTVYGGTLDVVSGKLVDKWGMIDLGTLNWNYNAQFNMFYVALTLASSNQNQIVCAQYGAFSSWSALVADTTQNGIFKSSDANHSLYLRDTAYTDTVAFKTAMDGVMLCYELATPQTYQLTPTEVALLKGNNNVWSDGYVDVEYYADIQLYIEKMLG